MNKEEFVTITSEEYGELLRADEFLTALRLVGVDNWDGFDFALDIFRKEDGVGLDAEEFHEGWGGTV